MADDFKFLDANKKRLHELLKQSTDAFENPELTNSLTLARKTITASPDEKSQIEKYTNKLNTKTIDTSNTEKAEEEKTSEFDKKTGKIRIDANRDGKINEEDDKYIAQQNYDSASAQKENLQYQNYLDYSNISSQVSYGHIEANLFSSTMLTHVNFSNKAIDQNTKTLVKTLSEHLNDTNRTSKEDAKNIQEAATIVSNTLEEKVYGKILGLFNEATLEDDKKNFDKLDEFIDSINENEYGLDKLEKSKLKDLMRNLTPEEMKEFISKNLQGVSDAEKELMLNSSDMFDAAEKYAKENNLEVGACAGSKISAQCIKVADGTFRANFLHNANDLLVEKGMGSVELSKENFSSNLINSNYSSSSYSYGYTTPTITSPEKIEPEANKKAELPNHDLELKDIFKQYAGDDLSMDKNEFQAFKLAEENIVRTEDPNNERAKNFKELFDKIDLKKLSEHGITLSDVGLDNGTKTPSIAYSVAQDSPNKKASLDIQH